MEAPGSVPSNETDPAELELYENSVARFQRVNDLKGWLRDGDIDSVKRILGDRLDDGHSICSEYKSIMGARIGTVGTIIMDLKKLQMHISKPNRNRHAYEVIAL